MAYYLLKCWAYLLSLALAALCHSIEVRELFNTQYRSSILAINRLQVPLNETIGYHHGYREQ